MPTRWIDFRALKAQVKIRDVLARYGFLEALKDKGNGRLVGPCPIHGGKSGNSFHVDTEKNVFHCFSECGGGNVLDLLMKVERCDIREAAEHLADWFGLTFGRADADKRPGAKPEVQRSAVRQTNSIPENRGSDTSSTASVSMEPAINPPLPGPLKTLNQDHPYLWSRGLTIATVREFGVGFCTRGLMKNRVAIGIHNERAELVAYAGRAIDEELAKAEGKYKLPEGFKKSHVVYNLNRAREHASDGHLAASNGRWPAARRDPARDAERRHCPNASNDPRGTPQTRRARQQEFE